MDIVFKCPKCHQQLEVDAGAAGQHINCPACSQQLTIPALDPQNMKVGIAAHTSAAAKEEKHFSVPVTATPSAPLIKKSLPPLEVAAKDGAKQLRIKTIRHTDCKEVGHDNFDKVVSEALEKIGEDNLVSINTVNYSYLEMGTQKMLTDYGVLILYKG